VDRPSRSRSAGALVDVHPVVEDVDVDVYDWEFGGRR
jgi:hypothetical protein